MTDLLIKILNLPIVLQRVIASSVILVVSILIICVLWAAFGTLNRQGEEIMESRRTLARFNQLIAMDDEHSLQFKAVSPSAEFLTGENEAVIQAALQNNLNSIAAMTRTTVLSAGGIQSTEINNVEYIGIRANLQGTLPAIHKLLLQLEIGKPYITIRDITVRSTNVNGRLRAPVELSVQLSFVGALSPEKRLQSKGVQQ